MRHVGLGLIVVATIGGSLTAVLDPARIELLYFLPCLALGVLGVVLVQVGIRREAQDESKLSANFEALDTSLGSIVKNVDALENGKHDLDVYALPARVDELFADDINTFVDARESIAHAYSVQDYADIMSHFAAGERYLNRVWSTAADGYIDEAHAYVEKSRDQFKQALGRLEGLRNGG